MAITLRATGAVSGGTLTPAPSFPAGVQASDINVLTVVAKPNSGVLPADVVIDVPAGWTQLFQGRAGNIKPGTPEGGSGGTNIAVFIRTGSAFTGSVPITISNHSTAAASIVTYAGSLGTGWSTGTVFGYDADNSGSTTYDSSRTVVPTNLLTTTNDWLLVCSSLSNGNGLGSATITSTGSTLGTMNVRSSSLSRVSVPDVADVWIDVRDINIVSGTSTAAPRMTASTIQDGVSVFIRLREGITSIVGSETKTIAEASSLGASDVVPTPRDWVNGDPLDAITLNAAFRDPLAWLLTESPGIQLEATAPVTFTTTTHTITWNTTPRYRRGSMVVSGTKLIVPSTGYYIGEVSVGIKDIDAMLNGWLLTVDVLMYPGSTGTPNVQNISATFTDMPTEGSFTVGSIPLSFFLNAGDAIEVKISGAWGTTADTGLLTDLPNVSILNMLDLHWQGYWGGGAV